MLDSVRDAQKSQADFISSPHDGYRKDIDGLRSLAILSVVLFHHGFTSIPGGFVGVDVFFVISGFLITGKIFEEIQRDGFSYLQFYERRLRRLFPALSVVILFTFAAAWFIFLPDEFWRYARSLVSSQLYVSNVVFWMEEDYFNGPSELKPLLHTWSLAVEEQFYLLIAPLLAFTYIFSSRNVLRVLVFMGAGSFLICELLLQIDASAAFYLLPARMWELLLGSCLALCVAESAVWGRFREPLAIVGLVAIVASFILLDKNMRFPGASAAFACAGTVLIIMSGVDGETRVSRLLSLAPLVLIGRLSYSLYLWHWPVLVFAQYVNLEPLRSWQHLLLLPVSLTLSFLSYRFVEQPFRSRRFLSRNQIFAASAAISLGFILVGLGVWRTDGAPSRFPHFAEAAGVSTEAQDRRAGICMLGPEQQAATVWSPSVCKLVDGAGSPMLVLGDSHAAHLRHGIEAFAGQINRPVYLISSSACPPIFDVHVRIRPNCLANNTFALEQIRRHGIKTVMLAANWSYAATNGVSLAELQRTVLKLQSMDIDVWVVGQLPIYALKNPQYLSYRLKSANYAPSAYRVPPRNGSEINDLLKSIVPAERYLDVYSPFCSEGRCAIFQNGQLMVVDSAHLSPEGSAFVVGGMVAKGAFR